MTDTQLAKIIDAVLCALAPADKHLGALMRVAEYVDARDLEIGTLLDPEMDGQK
jgi:hypothetical protein